MTIIRSKRPQRNFTIIDNHLIRNPKLTRGARALLIEILSYPDDWRTSSEQLARQGLEGRDAIRRMIRELEEKGYCRRVKKQDEKGRWTSKWYVFDTPVDEPVDIVWTSSKPSYSPASGNPSSESQALIEELNTKDYAKKSETWSGSSRNVCEECDGEGYAGDDLSTCRVCEGRGLI